MRSTLKITALAASIFMGLASKADAGPCPEEHRLTEPRELEKVGTKWLTREIIANVQLEGEMEGFLLRQRHLELAPGGTVAFHRHDGHPAIVYITKAAVTEHNSFCGMTVVHHAETPPEEFGDGFAHYWKNTGTETVTYISTDVVPFASGGTPFYGWEGGVSPDEQYGQ